jgi:hypothetical protein
MLHLRYTNLFILYGIRWNCHSSGRNPLLYQFIERVIRQAVIFIFKESPSYQLPTKFFASYCLGDYDKEDEVGGMCGMHVGGERCLQGFGSEV